MPALKEISKYKRLAELFVHAMKSDTFVNPAANNQAIDCLIDHGLSERQAEKFLDDAFKKHERGMIRSIDQTLKDAAMIFRKDDHGYILSQIQSIIEKSTINNETHVFFDQCCDLLFHDG